MTEKKVPTLRDTILSKHPRQIEDYMDEQIARFYVRGDYESIRGVLSSLYNSFGDFATKYYMQQVLGGDEHHYRWLMEKYGSCSVIDDMYAETYSDFTYDVMEGMDRDIFAYELERFLNGDENSILFIRSDWVSSQQWIKFIFELAGDRMVQVLKLIKEHKFAEEWEGTKEAIADYMLEDFEV